jgi:hypothetical protein
MNTIGRFSLSLCAVTTPAEGHSTRDLMEAKALLEELAG